LGGNTQYDPSPKQEVARFGAPSVT
jgi:hypothetical protein